jgi:putative ABC transport system permease protein
MMARDIVVVAMQGLLARKVRTALVLFGPALGVAALVGVLGLSASARGDVRASLRELGTNLLVVDAVSASGGARLPPEADERLARVSSITMRSAVSSLSGIDVASSRAGAGSTSLAQTLQVRAADSELASILNLAMVHGRFLNEFDDRTPSRGVVLGSDAAAFFVVEPGAPRTVLLNGEPFAVVGVLGPIKVLPELNRSIFVSFGTARKYFLDPGHAAQFFVRTTDGTTAQTADILPVAITYGGPGSPVVRVPTDLLEARAQVDSTFRVVVLALGGLSLLVGGIGIANVMTISVLQRSSEIGIRRALGHTRAIIAWQFMLEALVIGLAGALLGVVLGVAFVAAAADHQGWVLELSPVPIFGAGALAVLVSVVAGIYPAMRAARMEPLEALRAGQ